MQGIAVVQAKKRRVKGLQQTLAHASRSRWISEARSGLRTLV